MKSTSLLAIKSEFVACNVHVKAHLWPKAGSKKTRNSSNAPAKKRRFRVIQIIVESRNINLK